MPLYYDPPPPYTQTISVNAEERDSEPQGLLSYSTAGPFRYKVLLEDFWDWNDDDDDDDDEE